MVQELGKNGVQVVPGLDQGIIDSLSGAAPAHFHEVLFQRFQVALAQRARITNELWQLLHSFEARGAGKGERYLVIIEYMEDENVVPAMMQHFQTTEQLLAVGEQ